VGFCVFELFRSSFLSFCLVCQFLCHLLALRVLLLLNDLLEFFSLAFSLLAVLHVSWIQISNFVLFVVNVLIKGKIEKPSGQYFSLICNK
jgi:hypothetical protein